MYLSLDLIFVLCFLTCKRPSIVPLTDHCYKSWDTYTLIPICILGSHTTCVKEPNAWVLVVLHRISVQSFQVSPRDLYSGHYYS